jgi:phage terminase large subunit-like protein
MIINPAIKTLDNKLSFSLLKWQIMCVCQILAGVVKYLFVPRQNGKSQILLFVCIFEMIANARSVFYTSHLTHSCNTFFNKMVAEFSYNPAFKGLIHKITYAEGRQKIQLKNGAYIQFSTRSRKKGIGDTVDILVCDEAQFLTDSEISALLPTQITRSDIITIFAGTPPLPDFDGSYILRQRKQFIGTEVWKEWSLNAYLTANELKVEDLEISDEVLAACNPSWDELIDQDNLRQNVLMMIYQDFLREHLGYWESLEPPSIFNVNALEHCIYRKEEKPPSFSNVSIGVKFSVDGEHMAICVAQQFEDAIHIQAVDVLNTDIGLEWTAKWILERRRVKAILTDGVGSDNLKDRVKKKYSKRFKVVSTGEVINANANLVQRFNEGSLVFFDQPGFLQAIKAASKRPIGKAGGFGFDTLHAEIQVDIVAAAALAAYRVGKIQEQKVVDI